jgi:hypothetical protein
LPDIAVINRSGFLSDVVVQEMLPAFDQQWNRDLRPIWGVEPATFTFVPWGVQPASGTWSIIFVGDSDEAGALGYHDLTHETLPLSKIFVKSILNDNASLSVGATREMCEMAVDPGLNRAYQDRDGVFWACEVCDPVADERYGYKIGGILVTDFVTPNWFGHQHAQGQLDFKGHAATPFEVLPGGYAHKFDPQQGWLTITGAKARHSEVIYGSRRERRTRRSRTGERSAIKSGSIAP